MPFVEIFIRRPIGTSLLALGIVLLGAIAYLHLAVASLPTVDLPTIRVFAQLPGASPETVSTALAMPLERRLGQIAGVTEITSSSSLGGTSITVQFDLDRDIEGAANDVQAALSAAATELPADMPNAPFFRKSNPAMMPLLMLALTSDTLPPGKLFDYAETVIAQKISQIEGVSEVVINGAEKTAVRVKVNPAALAARGIGMEDVRTAINQSTVNFPKGSLDGPSHAATINANDQLFDPEHYKALVIGRNGDATMRLGDIASVTESVANTRIAGWYNGRRSVIVYVQREPNANLVETVDRVLATLPQIERWVPPSIKLAVLSDRSAGIRTAILEVQITLGVTAALVVMVIFLFLRRLRATLIPSATIPVSLAGTFGVMYLLGYSLDNLSLMALTVSIGFVVDDAIVMLENVTRYREAGHGPMEAALKGAREIGFTIVSITASLVAAFIPLLFMGSVVGRFMREFAVTLSTAIIVSAVVSLTLAPAMCARLLSEPALDAAADTGRLGALLDRAIGSTLAAYDRSLRWVLRHRIVMLTVTLLACVGTVELYINVPKGFVPQQDTGIIWGGTEASQDVSFPAMVRYQRAVVRTILADPAVDSLGSFIGPGAISGGRVFINLKPLEERKVSTAAVIDRLRPKLGAMPGISTYLSPSQDFWVGGRQSNAPYQFTLQDENWDELKEWIPRVVERLKRIPELKDVGTDQQGTALQTTLKIDRDRASALGISTQAIDAALYDAFGQRQVALLYTPTDQFRVVLEAEVGPQTPEALHKLYVKSSSGEQIPLAAVTRIEPDLAPLTIWHQGQFPSATISFATTTGVALSEATDKIQAAFAEMLPPGTLKADFQGNARAFRNSSSSQPLLLLAAIVTMYIVLGVLYESYVHPITILSTLPSAGLGALLSLMICGMELSMIAMIGIILLIGIVKKNAIMMIDFALDAERRDGLVPAEAIYRACLMRFRPITMTTLTALIGSLPLAIGTGPGSELRQPLGVAIVGGLIVSQILTLYTTPVIYLYIDRLRGWRRRRAGPGRAVAAPSEQPAE